MSNKDVSRYLDQPEKHYVAGRLQQGRPLLDSDYNESHQLHERDRQAALVALLGPKACPAHGFAVGRSTALYRPMPNSLRPLMQGDHLAVHRLVLGGLSQYVHATTVLPGSLYVGGLRFEQVQAEHIALQRGFLQMQQGAGLPYVHRSLSPSPESPHSPKLVYSPSSPSSPYSPENSPHSPTSPGSPDFPTFRNFYYLNAWEQAVTAVEDEELLESALNGPDTTVRIRRMHRVEVLGQLPSYMDSCGEAFDELIRQLEANNGHFDRATYELKSKGRLQLVFQELELRDQCEACTLDPDARYLGQENQALRIMLTQARRYVWAFDNGAPLYRVKVTGLSANSPSDVTVHLLTPPKDAEHFPKRHQVVEIIPFGAVLDGAEHLRPDHPHFQKIAAEMGAFLRVKADYDSTTGTFKLETGPTAELADRIQQLKRFITRWSEAHPASRALDTRDPNGGDGRFFYMRVWHIAEDPSQIELPAAAELQGEPLGRTGLVPVFHAAGRPGDSWLATLRVDEPHRITPYGLLTAAEGVPPQGPRHYYAPLGLIHGDGHEVYGVSDCRKTIKRVTERSCATRTVGDGQVSFGDYATIQAAVNSLPIEGGTVLIYPGEYRDPVVIAGRGNITLKGCGASTVLEPVAFTSTVTAVVKISACERVTLQDLTIHAARDAVEISSCADIELNGVGLVAGSISTAGFVPTVNDTTYCLVNATSVTRLRLSNLSLVAGTRQAIRLYNVLEARLTNLDNTTDDEHNSTIVPNSYLSFSGCTDLRFEDSSLTFHSRVGVSITATSNARLAGLSLDGSSSSYTLAARSVVVLSASCHAVELSESRFGLDSANLSTDAVLVLAGSNNTLEDSTIEVSEANRGHIWGGVWVRSGARSTTIRNNRILRGYGHGITLGSARWYGGSPTAELSPSVGPGAGNMTRVAGTYPETNVMGLPYNIVVNGTSYVAAFDEGAVVGLTIVHNHIEGMGTSGISVLALKLSVDNGKPLLLEEVLIENNTITKNLQQIGVGMPVDMTTRTVSTSVLNKNEPLSLQRLPFGGVVLSVVAGSTVIRGNRILDNRSPKTVTDLRLGLPVNGIFCWAADDLTISDNRIVENGAVLPVGMTPAAGVRAGIAVLIAGINGFTDLSRLDDLKNTSPDSKGLTYSNSALRVFGNTVRQPEGRALQALSYGMSAVFGNFFSADGNLGNSIVTAETSLVGDVVFLENLAAPWERRGTVPSEHLSTAELRYIEPVANIAKTNATQSSAARANGRGGHLLFSSNQVTFAWDATHGGSGTVSYYPVALYSVDHVGAHGNQLAFRVGLSPAAGNMTSPSSDGANSAFNVSTPLVTQLFAGAYTVNLSHNRFSESLRSTLFSGVAYGQYLGLVAHNQGSHDFACYGPALLNGGAPTNTLGNLRLCQYGNQALYSSPEALPGSQASVTKTGARLFFERQFRIIDTATPAASS